MPCPSCHPEIASNTPPSTRACTHPNTNHCCSKPPQHSASAASAQPTLDVTSTCAWRAGGGNGRHAPDRALRPRPAAQARAASGPAGRCRRERSPGWTGGRCVGAEGGAGGRGALFHALMRSRHGGGGGGGAGFAFVYICIHVQVYMSTYTKKECKYYKYYVRETGTRPNSGNAFPTAQF